MFAIKSANTTAVFFDVDVAFEVAVAVAFDFEVRMGTLPNVARVSRELLGNMFERSELVSQPD